VIFPCLIKYKDTNSKMLQVPLSTAFNKGKYGVNDGATAGPGIKWRFKMTNNGYYKNGNACNKTEYEFICHGINKKSGIKTGRAKTSNYTIRKSS
jgi:hypothetical protein